ncbi:hypothetical protein [Streptomyces niveus]|uniref:hypothetical protein n=1 Tax=Streptomyces niveus TaxID=193462 RepID=UPI0003C57DBF|nr:hypothetical protein [Streptomyces niveus]EST28573.1 hypothetical protein M877_14735 [Streptomyces niveus NCIMB 11891]
MSRAARLAAHGAVGTALSVLSDRRLAELIAGAVPLGSGLGGRSAELDVDADSSTSTRTSATS